MKFSNYVLSLIRKFHRIAPWVEPAELQQVAALAYLEAAQSYPPNCHASLDTYRDSAVRYMLSHHIDRARSPVTASTGKLAAMREMKGFEIQERDLPPVEATLEQDLDIAAAKVRLRAIMSLMPPAASAVLLEERKPAEVARSMRVPVRQVYVAALRARRALARNEELRQLMAS
jgi:DNA-directed RNA polymerase specialized sigma24 family protein